MWLSETTRPAISIRSPSGCRGAAQGDNTIRNDFSMVHVISEAASAAPEALPWNIAKRSGALPPLAAPGLICAERQQQLRC